MHNSIIIQITKSGIATIILNRPEKHNAFDDILIKDLINALKKIDADSTIRVVIIKAEGKDFCAGADVQWMQRMKNFSEQENLDDAKQLAMLFKILYQLNKPTIALIQGAVSGGGNGLVACCDIAIARNDATFIFSEVKLGIVPASISPYVIKAIGTRTASRYFLTAEKFDANEALRIGLIHKIVDCKSLQNAGEEIANQLLKNGPKALTVAKQLIHRSQPINKQFIEETIQIIADIRISEEAQEGFQAFLEKRAPNWES